MALDIVLYVVSGLLMVTGLFAAILPSLPGIPIIFAGIWLAAGVDHYRHIGLGWLIGIAVVGVIGLVMDFVAAALGAKRIGASKLALWGALLGTLVGLFFSIPGLLLGPFVGALLGELVSGQSVLRSAHVGASTWLGLIFGTLVKLACALMMLGLFAFGWWINHRG